MASVVKITVDDDGRKTNDNHWHHVYYTGGSDCKLCTLEVFGIGESSAEYETKEGKITCPNCIAIIKEFKKVKL